MPHPTPAQATPPAPPAPAAQAVAVGAPRASAADVYNAMRAQRTELKRQLESLEDKRGDLTRELQDGRAGSADRAGIEARIKEIDARISSVDQEIAASEAAVAKAAAIPGAVVAPPPIVRNGPPEEAFVLGGMFMVIILLPLSIAVARRIWRRGSAAPTVAVPPELSDRFTRLEQAVDAIAVEVERVGEGQRFISRQFAEQGSVRALGAGAAEPIDLRQREQVPIDQRR